MSFRLVSVSALDRLVRAVLVSATPAAFALGGAGAIGCVVVEFEVDSAPLAFESVAVPEVVSGTVFESGICRHAGCLWAG
jgi:hypothetical protein